MFWLFAFPICSARLWDSSLSTPTDLLLPHAAVIVSLLFPVRVVGGLQLQGGAVVAVGPLFSETCRGVLIYFVGTRLTRDHSSMLVSVVLILTAARAEHGLGFRTRTRRPFV